MRSGIVFLISFCLLSTTCIQQRQKLETKECSTTQADTSFIVVDSTLLLYLKKNTSDKEIYAVLEERPEYPGGMKEAIKYIQTHIQYPPAAIYKKIQGRVWIESVIDRNGKVVQPKVAYSVHPPVRPRSTPHCKNDARLEAGETERRDRESKIRFSCNLPS